MKLQGFGIAAVAALGAAALYYLWRKHQGRALANRTNADLLREPIMTTQIEPPIIRPPDVIYINPVRLQ